MVMRILTTMLRGYAIYWPKPSNDGTGGTQVGAPIELRVRWTQKVELMQGVDGKEFTSMAKVNVDTDMEVKNSINEFVYKGTDGWGWLLEGRLADLPLALRDSPQAAGANIIMLYRNLPTLKYTQYLRTAWL